MQLAIALVFLTTISLHAANEPRSAGANLFETARLKFNAGELDAALATLDQIDKKMAAMAEVIDLRGAILMEQGKLAEAEKAFQAAHAANKDLILPRIHLGDVLFRRKKYGKAREGYEAVARGRNTPVWEERVRYAILLTYLAQRDEIGARGALDRIKFPTETPAYYYAQAAWEFAHNRKREARKWIKTSDRIFDASASAYFARPLIDFGWLKKKPILVPM